MMEIKIWKDKDGFAFEIGSERFGISNDEMSLLIDELQTICDEQLEDDDESILRHISLGMEDAE
jgi:hypothetical protein